MEGTLHIYYPRRNLKILEILSYSKDIDHRPKPLPADNVLLFIGGLYDTFGAPGYVANLASLFPINEEQSWRVMHIQLSSTMRAWGIFDLDRDIEEIGIGIKYIRDTLFGENTKIVIMGHSTGCQDVMHYLTAHNPSMPDKPTRPVVQGGILQAPVSDREMAMDRVMQDEATKAAYKECLHAISRTPESEHRSTILPLHWTTPLFDRAPISMFRFLSLTSPESPTKPSTDDFFSSDLSDETFQRTFGIIGTDQPGLLKPSNMQTANLLVLIGDIDEGMPAHINKAQLLLRWRKALESSNAVLDDASTCIPHAIHDISGDDLPSQKARMIYMRKAVLQYLSRVVGNVTNETWMLFENDQKEIEKQESRL